MNYFNQHFFQFSHPRGKPFVHNDGQVWSHSALRFAKGLDPVQTSTTNHAYFKNLLWFLVHSDSRKNRTMMTCRVTSKHAIEDWSGLGIFWYGFLFSLSFRFIINFSLINSDMYTTLLSSATWFVLFLFSFFVFLLHRFYQSEQGFIRRIYPTFLLIQPIPSSLAAAQDKMKRARAFKLTVTVIDRWL